MIEMISQLLVLFMQATFEMTGVNPSANGAEFLNPSTRATAFGRGLAQDVIPRAFKKAPGAMPVGLHLVGQVSVVTVDDQRGGKSEAASISGDGRYVAFVWLTSDSGKGGKTERKSEIFLRDQLTGKTVLVSKVSDGTPADGNSGTPVLSTDGRYIAFVSQATNLTDGDQNGQPDIFVYDRQTNQISLVSMASDGHQGNADSFDPWISPDGRYVAFSSDATNLVEGDTNGRTDVFIHDRKTGATTRVSIATNGLESNAESYSPSISADGRFVAFESEASNLVLGDANEKVDVFVHDHKTGKTTRVSIASDGTQGNHHSVGPSISWDGRFVAFQSYATNLIVNDTSGYPDIFIHDLKTGVTERVSVASDGTQANAESYFPSVNHDGRYIVFHSLAWNLVPGDTNGKSDIFIHDRKRGFTQRVSLASDGSQANGGSYSPAISRNGRFVTFTSNATNLMDRDGPSQTSVFVVSLP